MRQPRLVGVNRGCLRGRTIAQDDRKLGASNGSSRRAHTIRCPSLVGSIPQLPFANQQRHDVEPMRSAVRLGTAPVAALILDLDPHVGAEQLTADGERPDPGQAVQDRVGGELGHDQRRIVGHRDSQRGSPTLGSGPK